MFRCSTHGNLISAHKAYEANAPPCIIPCWFGGYLQPRDGPAAAVPTTTSLCNRSYESMSVLGIAAQTCLKESSLFLSGILIRTSIQVYKLVTVVTLSGNVKRGNSSNLLEACRQKLPVTILLPKNVAAAVGARYQP